MKKIFFLLLLILMIFPNNVQATEEDMNSNSLVENSISTDEIIESQQEMLDIDSFIEEADKYTENVYEDLDMNEIFSSALSGNIENSGIIKSILNLIGGEILDAIKILASILVIIVIHSILKNISEGLENKGIAQITYYVQYILIVTLIMTNFVQILDIIKESIQNLVNFINLLVPILITLMITTGHVVSANLMQAILLFVITFIGNLVTNVIIPIVLISTSLGIVSKISDKVQIDKLSKFFKSSVVWVLGVVLTIFVGLTSVEGSLSGNVDAVTAKTAKAAVSSFIPVVGKILGDAVDTVIGCSTILKNATGIVGIIIIIGIVILPIIKLAILMGIYYLGAALCQPIADGKIVSLLDQIGDTFKTFLAILCSISVMLIIGITIVIKMSL